MNKVIQFISSVVLPITGVDSKTAKRIFSAGVSPQGNDKRALEKWKSYLECKVAHFYYLYALRVYLNHTMQQVASRLLFVLAIPDKPAKWMQAKRFNSNISSL